MPGLPLVVHEHLNVGSSFNNTRSAVEMCREEACTYMTAEEAFAAEESLSVYCKPVELYNILQRRAIQNPSFLQRCLSYKTEVKCKRRVRLVLLIAGIRNKREEVKKMFPFCVLLVRPVCDATLQEHSIIYRIHQTCVITDFHEDERKDQTEASFILPEMKKLLADSKSSSLYILLVSYEEVGSSHKEISVHSGQPAALLPSRFEGCCFCGRIHMEPLYYSWNKSGSFNTGNKAEIPLIVDMQPTLLKMGGMARENCLMFHGSDNLGNLGPRQVNVNLFAEKIGIKEKSYYDFCGSDHLPTSSVSRITRLRSGNVIFNYRYYNNKLQKTEVTEDFTCPFCLIRCGSFEGLRCHLTCCHDIFSFEFWATRSYQTVNVSVKADVWRPEIVADGVDPRLQTFMFSSKSRKRRRVHIVIQHRRHEYPYILKLDSPESEGVKEASHGAFVDEARTSSSCLPTESYLKNAQPSYAGSSREDEAPKMDLAEECLQSDKSENVSQNTEFVGSSVNPINACPSSIAATPNHHEQTLSGSSLVPPTMLQFAKTRKLSAERIDMRNRALLEKRQFFHSHRAQPMTMDEVLSDRDSEDEVDDDIADFEDRRMLDDFVDVTKDEKQIMHLWNSFVRKQRVLADGHIPWACEAFSRLHGADLSRSPALIWCWRLFMIKLWNHSLLDARTMNNCNLILEDFQEKPVDSTLS